MGFRELSERSIETFGVDLAAYSSRAMEDADSGVVGPSREQLGALADEVLDKVLRRVHEKGVAGALQMQFSTRERLADYPGDVLRVDATGLLQESMDPTSRQEAWMKIHEGLLDVKRRVSQHFSRSSLRVHGSKHLTAAFMLGYVFPSTVCELEVRTKHGYWSTDCDPASQDPLLATVSDGTVGLEDLYLEVSTGDKLVRDAVRRHVQRTRVSPLKYLRFTPGQDLEAAPYMTNADACAIARQLRRQLSRTISDYGISPPLPHLLRLWA
jgi:hypothetical protein